MKDKEVIKRSNLPNSLPVTGTLTIILAMDRINAPSWTWGVVITLLTIIWIGAVWRIACTKEVDIFKRD